MCPELEHGFYDDTVIIYDAGLFAPGKCYLKEYLLMFFPSIFLTAASKNSICIIIASENNE